MKFRWKFSDEDNDVVKFLENDRKCPKCSTECDVDTSGSNERDSSGDIHFCPNCKWECRESHLWLVENALRDQKHNR